MIEHLGARDLPELAACARDFYAASRFLHTFDMARFEAVWTTLLASGTGVVLGLREDGEVVGTIGGVVYAEPYSGDLIATEFFWFVRPGRRGGGMRLYRAFEAWAREQNCTQIRMGHLSDSMPQKVKRVYERLGFEEVETNYAKPLRSTP